MGRTNRTAGVLGAAVALFLALAQVTSQPSRIHEQLTSDELRSIFHVDHTEHVPEYHLVQLTHHLSRRHIPSSHPVNNLNYGPSKVPHEKINPAKAGNKYRSPSLLNDEMVYNSKFNLEDVDIFGELEDELPIVIGDENAESEIKKKTAESVGNGSAVSDTKESGSDSKVSQSASEHDMSDRELVSETQEDGTHRINLEAFGKQLDLVLKKQNSLLKKDGLKMWSAVSNETHPHGVEYLEMHSDDDEDIGELFHDEESGAALLIRREPKSGKLMVEGSIGHELVIKALPPSVTAPPEDDEMFLEPASMADMVSIDTGLPIRRAETERERLRRALAGAHHVIYRRTAKQAEDEMSDYAFMEPDHLAKRYRRRRSAEATEEAHSRSKRGAPNGIYPEILVIVDYDGYRLHGGDNVQIKRYFVSFWNGVDLRYKLLKGPRIHISIAGIIISRGRDATPYLEKNRVGRDAIDSAAALTDMGKYLFRERKLPVYDIAVAITKLDMCRRQFANDACNRGTAGFAYVGGACVVNKRLEKVNSVAIIEDTGGFSGIIVAAHEVGHLLGAVHDGSPPPSYLAGPGAEKCRWEDGFIMSDLRHTEKGFRWSSCSVQSFHHFLNGDTATCLYNSPHEDDNLPRVLPGRLLTLDAQCRKDRGTSACFKDERVCAQLFCFDSSSGYCVAYRPAAEGSPCGDGQYCINGRCIAEHENIIPDYSQHTPTYVRRDTSPFYGTNATSYEETTQPYQESEPSSPKNYYNYNAYQQSSTVAPQTYAPYTKPTNNIYQTSNQPSITTNPYKYFYQTQSTTKNQYDFRNYNNVVETQSTSYPSSYASTQRTFVYNKYSITSTKSPYDFNDYATTKKVKPFKPNEVTTNEFIINEKTSEKPKRFGFYNKYDFNSLLNRTTTKNPYNFSFDSKFHFNNNNIKPLYKIGTYYSQQKDENSVGPDASNRRSVEIEPARLVYSFQTNATALLSSRSPHTSQIAAATNGK